VRATLHFLTTTYRYTSNENPKYVYWRSQKSDFLQNLTFYLLLVWLQTVNHSVCKELKLIMLLALYKLTRIIHKYSVRTAQ